MLFEVTEVGPTFLGPVGEASVDGVVSEDEARQEAQGEQRQRGDASKHAGLP